MSLMLRQQNISTMEDITNTVAGDTFQRGKVLRKRSHGCRPNVKYAALVKHIRERWASFR